MNHESYCEDSLQSTYKPLRRLPQDVLSYIFLFDRTYRDYFQDQIVPYLNKRRIFRVRSSVSLNTNLYLMVDEDYAKLMNSVTKPTFCSTIYFSEPMQPKREYMKLFEILEMIRHHPDSTPVEFCSEIVTWKEFCDDV
jgi:hypothetical protein